LAQILKSDNCPCKHTIIEILFKSCDLSNNFSRQHWKWVAWTEVSKEIDGRVLKNCDVKACIT